MSFIRRFKNSIIFIIALCMYALCMASLFLLLGIENWQILEASRTSVIMIFTFVVMGFLLTRAYGGFDVGVRKSRPIAIALSLALILDDIVTYIVLIIMNTNEANGNRVVFISFGFLLLSMVIQVVIISVFTRVGNAFYFYVNPPEKTLIVVGEASEAEKVREAVSIFGMRYEIYDTVVKDEHNIADKIKNADSVFFYDVSKESLERLTELCYGERTSVYINPRLTDILLHAGKEVFFADLPFYHTEARHMTFEQRVIKRMGDIVISLLGLIITSPLFLIAACAIRREDGGSVFFRQDRATVGGKVFRIIKFRTMKENNGEEFSVTKDDDRITNTGRWLRKYRIDELPQLINILMGDMSLVGPRPEMMKNVEEYTADLPEFRYRLRMKAGLTGYAQVMGKYNTTSRDKLMLDLMYIENFSIAADVRILLQTMTVLFSADESTEGFDGNRS